MSDESGTAQVDIHRIPQVVDIAGADGGLGSSNTGIGH